LELGDRRKNLPLIHTDTADGKQRQLFQQRDKVKTRFQPPRHAYRCGGAEQVDQIIIKQAMTLKDCTQQTIDDGAEEAGKNDRRKLAGGYKICSNGGNGYARRAERGSDGPKEADASISPWRNGFEVGDHQRFAGEGHADFAGRCIAGGFSKRGQRQHRPCFARDGNDQRCDAKIRHGLCSGASPGGLSGAELLLARVTHASGDQSDSEDDEQRKEHAQIADSHDESDGRSGERTAQIHATGKPGQHRESGGDGKRGKKSAAARRELRVMQRCKDSQNRGGKAQRQQVRDPE